MVQRVWGLRKQEEQGSVGMHGSAPDLSWSGRSNQEASAPGQSLGKRGTSRRARADVDEWGWVSARPCPLLPTRPAPNLTGWTTASAARHTASPHRSLAPARSELIHM